jgi:hypothetical protein
MADLPEFQKKQYAFAAHIRNPRNSPAPDGIEDRRMAVYRDLFFNNLSSLLATTFPVLKKIHTPEQWKRFIRLFMTDHQAKTPYFLQLPDEFLAFLSNEYEPGNDDFPFLLELAHYEYAELAASISEEVNDLGGVDADGDLLAGVPVKSNLASIYAYQFPVHRISPAYLPTEPPEQPTFLAIYRRADFKVGFLELNPMTAALFEAVANNDAMSTGEQLLRELAASTQFADVDALIGHGAAALEEMRQLEILTGARSPVPGD